MAYTTLDITAIPSPLRIFIDEASALCKRHNTNVIEPLHLIAAIVRTRGAVLFHDCECQYNAIFTTLNSHLDSCGKTPEPGMFIDAELLDIIRELADTSTTTAALFLSLLKKTHDKVPDDLKSYIASLADNIQSTQEPEPAATPHSTDTATQSPPMQDTTITIGQMPFSAPAVAPNAEPEKKPLRQPYITYWDAHFIASFPHAIVGRDALLKKIVPVLLRRVDPAAIIIGDPGCGKTSLLRALASYAASGKIPGLEPYSFAALDIVALLCGVEKETVTTALLTDILQKVSKIDRLILIVDDLHLLLAQNGYPLTSDLASCFIPFLQAGTLRAIFTATTQSYEMCFSKHQTFSSHSSPFFLDELSGECLKETLLEATKPLKAFYHIEISPDALDYAIHLASTQQITYRPPGSCIKLIDNACALSKAYNEKIVLKAHIEHVSHDFIDSVPVHTKSQLRSLEDELKKYIYGQDEAVKIVSQRIRLTKLQLDRNPHRPDGVFLFLGPSGVGKTELAKALTLCLYNDMRRLVRIDMSEFMASHEYSKLIGAPPGYVGYGEEGALTGPVSKMGHAVILLDEIEKASDKILNLFLQLFDEGFLTDGKGKKVNFSQCVIIMTSNLGKELWGDYFRKHKESSIGFVTASNFSEQLSKPVLDYMLDIFPGEFINRIDDIILFRPLSREDIRAIAKKFLDDEVALWKKRGKMIYYKEAIIDFLADRGYKPELGARHVLRNLEKLVSEPLSHAACQDGWEQFSSITIEFDPQSGSSILHPAANNNPAF